MTILFRKLWCSSVPFSQQLFACSFLYGTILHCIFKWFFVQFKTDLAFIIDVIKPQSMYSKLLGHCGCYSFICNVAQKISAEPYKLPGFINYLSPLSISFIFRGKKCTFNDLPRFAADVVIINHKYLDSRLWCWIWGVILHFIFNMKQLPYITSVLFIWFIHVQCHYRKSVLFYYSCTCVLNKNSTYKTCQSLVFLTVKF